MAKIKPTSRNVRNIVIPLVVLIIIVGVSYLLFRDRNKQVALNLGSAETITYLSDLKPTYNTNGWGPYEIDMSNGEALSGDGHTISLNGTKFTKGLGVHAYSELRYNLGGSCTTFSAVVGVDDEMTYKGTVVFHVYRDGEEIYTSPIQSFSSANATVANLDISGANELKLAVTDGGNGNGGDHADWADAKVSCLVSPTSAVALNTSGIATYLSDVTPTSNTNGWGPYEKNMSNGEKAAGDGHTITINGATFAKGLGAHAYSELHFALNGSCTVFSAKVGVDDEMTTKGTVVFAVIADGTKIYQSPLLTYKQAADTITGLNMNGVKDLGLVVTDGGNGNGGDHADWADAKVTCTSTLAIAPTPSPAPSPTPTPLPSPTGDSILKVLQWNNAGETSTTEEQNEINLIVAQKPQVVFMEEVDSGTYPTRIMNALKTDQGGDGWSTYSMLRGTDTSSSFVVIISKYALSNTKYLDLRPAGTYGISCYQNGLVRYWDGRRAIGANITVGTRNVSIFDVRTSSDDDVHCVRQEEETKLKNWAYSSANGFYPDKVFGGDFNMQPGTLEYNYMVSSTNTHIDTWEKAVDLGTAKADNDATPDYYTPTRNTRLDYIFTNSGSNLTVQSALIRNVGSLSDHRMMITTLQVN